MVRLKLKLKKAGNSYALMIPKSLVDTGVINLENKEYAVEIDTIPSKDKILKMSSNELKVEEDKLNNELMDSGSNNIFEIINALDLIKKNKASFEYLQRIIQKAGNKEKGSNPPVGI